MARLEMRGSVHQLARVSSGIAVGGGRRSLTPVSRSDARKIPLDCAQGQALAPLVTARGFGMTPLCFVRIQSALDGGFSRLKQRLKNVLPVSEGLLDLAGYKEVLRDRAEESEADFIFDQVADDGAVDSVAGDGCELMPMVPGFEWALLLYIGEVVIPLEFGDVGDPLHLDRQKRKYAKGRGDP